jgi:hypothetical protein
MKRALLFGGVPAIVGIALIVIWAMADNAASRGNDWTQVLATIESAKVQPGAVDIAYRYEYGGRPYRNPAGHLTIRGGAKPDARYAAGRQILTYVNPATPSESILEPAPRPSSVNIIAGVVLLIIGIPLAIFLLREKQPQFRGRRKPVRKMTKPGTPSKSGKPTTKSMSRLKPPPSSLS